MFLPGGVVRASVLYSYRHKPDALRKYSINLTYIYIKQINWTVKGSPEASWKHLTISTLATNSVYRGASLTAHVQNIAVYLVFPISLSSDFIAYAYAQTEQ